MSILTGEEILKRIARREIAISPFHKKQVGPASIDLRLGTRFYVFKRLFRDFHVDEEASAAGELLEKKGIGPGENILLLPGETLLAETMERVKLPQNLCAQIEGRGRFARLGLSIHIAPGFVQPGVDGEIFFLLSNFGTAALRLYPGTPLCQLIIQETLGEARYAGKFGRGKRGKRGG